MWLWDREIAGTRAQLAESHELGQSVLTKHISLGCTRQPRIAMQDIHELADGELLRWAVFDILDSQSVSSAIQMLRRLSDQRKIIVKNIREMPIPGSYLGAVMQLEDRIDIYCDLSRPEIVRQAILVHEIVHIVLSREGFPEIVVKENVSSDLPPQQQGLATRLRDRFKSAIDHPEVFRRMTSTFELNLDSYFDAQVDQKLRMFQSGSKGKSWRDQDYYFERQQDIMWGIEFFWYPSKQRDQILLAFQNTHPDSHQSCLSLYSKIKGIGFQTPTSCYESAQIMKSHIISYGENRKTGAFNRMWEALHVRRPDMTSQSTV
jgi:hypothetical protein